MWPHGDAVGDGMPQQGIHRNLGSLHPWSNSHSLHPAPGVLAVRGNGPRGWDH